MSGKVNIQIALHGHPGLIMHIYPKQVDSQLCQSTRPHL